LATSIHSSAVIFAIAYPLRNIRLGVKLSVLAAFGVLMMMPFLSEIVNSLVPLLFGYRYAHYQNEGGAITLFLLYIVIFLLSLKIKLTNQQNGLNRSFILLAVACQSLGYISTGAVTRIGFYFSIFFSLLFPILVNSYIDKKSRGFTSAILSLLLFAFFYLTNKGGYLNVVPYYFFWEKPFLYN
jgi:hypothetical protein